MERTTMERGGERRKAEVEQRRVRLEVEVNISMAVREEGGKGRKVGKVF